MVHQVASFSDALLAWEQWNLTDFDHKSAQVLSFKSEMESQSAPLAAIMTFHLEQAFALLAEHHLMAGPTGETNELYAAGRGVALVIVDDFEEKLPALQTAMAMITTALLAGNSVQLCSDDVPFNTLIADAAKQASLPTNLVQVASYDAAQLLLSCDVRSVAYVGNSQTAQAINLQLAKRDGAIVSLVAETDLKAMNVAHDPHLALRFITERTRTINITAVGGNATLLELGSEAH
ncbi:1-pyrroline-5-carboxylate dehydrogenase [Vibrio artabrorum]|uniref:1-pyrroline-5-carboxylate dehydrogenase n=1 Tax=Vibrio artabrorum TaxID=446374 RepID=UPI00354F64C2